MPAKPCDCDKTLESKRGVVDDNFDCMKRHHICNSKNLLQTKKSMSYNHKNQSKMKLELEKILKKNHGSVGCPCNGDETASEQKFKVVIDDECHDLEKVESIAIRNSQGKVKLYKEYDNNWLQTKYCTDSCCREMKKQRNNKITFVNDDADEFLNGRSTVITKAILGQEVKSMEALLSALQIRMKEKDDGQCYTLSMKAEHIIRKPDCDQDDVGEENDACLTVSSHMQAKWENSFSGPDENSGYNNLRFTDLPIPKCEPSNELDSKFTIQYDHKEDPSKGCRNGLCINKNKAENFAYTEPTNERIVFSPNYFINTAPNSKSFSPAEDLTFSNHRIPMNRCQDPTNRYNMNIDQNVVEGSSYPSNNDEQKRAHISQLPFESPVENYRPSTPLLSCYDRSTGPFNSGKVVQGPIIATIEIRGNGNFNVNDNRYNENVYQPNSRKITPQNAENQEKMSAQSFHSTNAQTQDNQPRYNISFPHRDNGQTKQTQSSYINEPPHRENSSIKNIHQNYFNPAPHRENSTIKNTQQDYVNSQPRRENSKLKITYNNDTMTSPGPYYTNQMNELRSIDESNLFKFEICSKSSDVTPDSYIDNYVPSPIVSPFNDNTLFKDFCPEDAPEPKTTFEQPVDKNPQYNVEGYPFDQNKIQNRSLKTSSRKTVSTLHDARKSSRPCCRDNTINEIKKRRQGNFSSNASSAMLYNILKARKILSKNNSNLCSCNSLDDQCKQSLNNLDSRSSFNDENSSTSTISPIDCRRKATRQKYTLNSSHLPEQRPIRRFNKCECKNNWTISVIPSLINFDENGQTGNNICGCHPEKKNNVRTSPQRNVMSPVSRNSNIYNGNTMKEFPSLNEVVTIINSKDFYRDYKKIIDLYVDNSRNGTSSMTTRRSGKINSAKFPIGMNFQYLCKR